MNAYIVTTPGKVKANIVVAEDEIGAVHLLNSSWQTIVTAEEGSERPDVTRLAMFKGFIDAEKSVQRIRLPTILS